MHRIIPRALIYPLTWPRGDLEVGLAATSSRCQAASIAATPQRIGASLQLGTATPLGVGESSRADRSGRVFELAA